MKRPVLLTMALALVAQSAWAAESDDHDKAVVLFEEGRRYIQSGNCDAAVSKLNESLSFEASVGARLSLADCYDKTDPLTAWKHLREAARLAFLKQDNERFAIAEKRAAALEPALPKLRFQIPATVAEEPGFELRVDNELVDRFFYKDAMLATRPGKHLVEARASNRVFSQTVDAQPHSATNVAVVMQAEECRGGGPTGAGEPVGSGQRSAGLVLGGVGVAGLAFGTVMGIVTLAKKSDLDSACGGNADACTAAPGTVEVQRESMRNAATISTVSLIVGGFTLAGGAVLYFTAPRSAPVTGGPVRIVPSVGKNEGTMNLVGRW